jgi:hypothetical protein
MLTQSFSEYPHSVPQFSTFKLHFPQKSLLNSKIIPNILYTNKELVLTDQLKFDRLMFQMQIYIIFVLLLTIGAVSGGLEKVVIQAEFIADIYQEFPRSCIFIINPEKQQKGEN